MCFGSPKPVIPPPPSPAPAPQQQTARLVEDSAGVAARKKRAASGNPLLLSPPTLAVPGASSPGNPLLFGMS